MTEKLLDLPKSLQTRAARLRDDAAALGREAWLTSLGAIALAEDEGAKVVASIGERRSNLAKRGETVEQRLDARVDNLRERANLAGRRRAIRERVGSAVVQPISSAFERLGVPSRAELRELSAKVDSLTLRVNLLLEKLEQPSHNKGTEQG